MPRERPVLSRSDLPAEFTAETLRELPLSTLRRLADHRNGILSRDEQQEFDRVMHEVMRGTAQRVSQQLNGADWAAIRRDERARGERPSKTDLQLRRMARRIGQQVEVAEALAPGVDWSFARADDPATTVTSAAEIEPADIEPTTTARPTEPPDPTGEPEGTVSDLEARLSEQVELVEVMSEIADMSKRTYALEQQRDLQNVRTVFFGFVVSVAVLVSGWAPLVTARSWDERIWMIALTLGTVALAGGVYWLVRQRQVGGPASDD